MRTSLNIPALAFLLCATAGSCLALMEIADVSRERAKELGFVIQSNPSGPNEARVRLEFKANGALSSFSHVELEVWEGDRRVLSARLLPERTGPDGVTVVSFTADPAHLAKGTLMIVATPGERTRIGHRLRVKDFVEPEKAR